MDLITAVLCKLTVRAAGLPPQQEHATADKQGSRFTTFKPKSQFCWCASSLIHCPTPSKDYPSSWNLSGITHSREVASTMLLCRWSSFGVKKPHHSKPQRQSALKPGTGVRSTDLGPCCALQHQGDTPRYIHCSPRFHSATAPRGTTCLGAVRCTDSWTHYIGSRVKKDMSCQSPGVMSSDVTGSTFGSGNGEQQTNIPIYLWEVVCKKGS